jgi:hypothetical protein
MARHRYHALSGRHAYGSRIPRAMPWAALSCSFRAPPPTAGRPHPRSPPRGLRPSASHPSPLRGCPPYAIEVRGLTPLSLYTSLQVTHGQSVGVGRFLGRPRMTAGHKCCTVSPCTTASTRGSKMCIRTRADAPGQDPPPRRGGRQRHPLRGSGRPPCRASARALPRRSTPRADSESPPRPGGPPPATGRPHPRSPHPGLRPSVGSSTGPPRGEKHCTLSP